MTDLNQLPPDLPVPTDDGACDHLRGRALPTTRLASTSGGDFDLATSADMVLFVYPRTGGPGITLPDDWDSIPGARGCTPQNCAFRDSISAFGKAGFEVVGLSAQSHGEQAEFAQRNAIPYLLVSDSTLSLSESLGLPTFTAGGLELYKRVTLVVRGGTIERVFYPVFPPDENAATVLAYLRS